MKIVCFGDSITAGYNNESEKARISPIIKKKLRTLGSRDEIILHGVCGEDTNDGLKRLSKVMAENADYTIIFFGANDAANHHAVSPKEFYKNIQVMVENLGTQKIILVTPPYHNDQVENENRSNDLVQLYREQALQVATDFRLPVIDLFSEMNGNDELLLKDGLHFSESGYELLTRLIDGKLKELS